MSLEINTYENVAKTFATQYDIGEEELDKMHEGKMRDKLYQMDPLLGSIPLIRVFLHARKYVAKDERDAYIRQFLAKPLSYRKIDDLTEEYLSNRRRGLTRK